MELTADQIKNVAEAVFVAGVKLGRDGQGDVSLEKIISDHTGIPLESLTTQAQPMEIAPQQPAQAQ
jgi:hypothetical protein